MADINGTTGADTLTGTAGDDTINGFAGQDQLNGKAGNDVINGGSDRDVITGGLGDDVADGGDGDDLLLDEGGSDRLRGGLGNDDISIYRYDDTGLVETVSIEGGGGDDRVHYTIASSGSAVIDLGDGNDSVRLGRIQDGGVRLTLGIGRDRIELEASAKLEGRAIVTDFSPGDAGEVVLLDRYLDHQLANWDKTSNPFGTGQLKLVASGADTLLVADADGTGLDYAPTTLLILANTAPSQFTATNFDGFGPDGAPVAPRALVGTSGPETLTGAAGDDRIDGLDGFDQIDGKAGDDVLNGGGGSDFIHGGYGDDRIDGGDGQDNIFDDSGSDTLLGGAGDDGFSIYRSSIMGGGMSEPAETLVIDGGSGNDAVSFGSSRAGTTAIDMGDGDDRVGLSQVSVNAVRITLGLGRDVVTLSAYRAPDPGTVVVADFATGADGDIVSLESFISSLIGWDENANPFGTSGYLRLQGSGTSTLLQVDRDGATGSGSFATFLTFENSRPEALVAANFEGLSPDGRPIVGRTLSGTNNADSLTGGLGADTITGFGGDDRIDGKGGADIINGGAGRDNIYSGLGDDQVDGGDGDDYIWDDGGSDSLRGGGGDDDISVYRSRAVAETIAIEGGAGADEVAIFVHGERSITVDLGIGDDVLRLNALSGGDLRAALGAGRDTVHLPHYSVGTGRITLTDFAAGASGDVLRFDDYLNAELIGWDNTSNPFGAGGFLRLAQFGTTVLLQMDRDGAGGSNHGFANLLTLENSAAAQLTAANFGGFAPTAVDAATATTISVTAPASIAEDGEQPILLDVTFKNVGQASGTVTVTFAAGQSSATNGSDVNVPAYTGSYNVSQSLAGSYTIALPAIAVLADQVAEGTETVAVTVRASGQVFDTGTDTKTVVVKLIDSGQTGGAGADTLTGTRFADDLTGGGGDDRLAGGLGDDRIDGGAGADTARFAGLFGQSVIGVSAAVVTVAGPDGRDTVTGVERLQFADGVYVVDTDAIGSQIIRLYDAVLGRAPDAGGLDFYLDQVEDRGGTLLGVAGDLAGSAEFQAATGGLSDAAFVDQVFRQALGRAPDAGGAAYYTQALDRGMSRGAFVIELSESAEHRGLTAGLVAPGYFNTDDSYQAVALLYDSFLGRRPDQGGLEFYGEQVKSGALSLAQVAGDFAGSAEFRGATQGKSNAELIDHVYRNTLDRAPDAGGAAHYTERLDGGMALADFVAEVGFSTEHYNLMSAYIIGGIDVI